MIITGEIRSIHKQAPCIARSVSADNLSEMKTSAEGDLVVCRIESRKIRSVIASVDDYLTNIVVAEEVCEKIADSTDFSETRNSGMSNLS